MLAFRRHCAGKEVRTVSVMQLARFCQKKQSSTKSQYNISVRADRIQKAVLWFELLWQPQLFHLSSSLQKRHSFKSASGHHLDPIGCCSAAHALQCVRFQKRERFENCHEPINYVMYSQSPWQSGRERIMYSKLSQRRRYQNRDYFHPH